MKKQLLFLAIMLMALVTGCKKESTPETKLVEGIELPPLTEQFAEGSPITVKGSGFTEADQIAFRTQTKASTDVTAEITAVGATQITFIVPSGLTVGENPIVLKRGGIEQVLGSVSIAETPDAKLYGFGWNDGSENCVAYSIDKVTGSLTEVKTLAVGQDMSSSVAIGRVAYGVNFPKKIGSFNFDTKTYKDLGSVANIECLGVIDGKLHIITSTDGAISLSQVNTETGALTLVADFGKVENAEIFENTGDAPFTYDVKNKTILMLGWWYNNATSEEYSQPITLNIDKKSISLLPRFTEADKSWGEFFAKGEQICVTVQRVLNYDTPQESAEYDIYTLNSKYELDQKLKTITEYCFGWQYDTKADMMFSVYEKDPDHGLCSFDFKTSTLKIMQKNASIDNVVLVR